MSAFGVALTIEIPVVSAFVLETARRMFVSSRKETRERAAAITEQLDNHGDALARVLAVLFPEGGRSLTDTLHDLDLRTAVVESHVTPKSAPGTP